MTSGFDERAARDWLGANFEAKVKEFGLGDWRVRAEEAEFDRPWQFGEADVQPDYRRAVIRLDLSKFSSVEHLERSLEHELLHVCAYHVYDTAWKLISSSSMPESEQNIVKEALLAAIERDCRQLETLVSMLRRGGEG